MSVSPSFQAYVLEQLGRVTPALRPRRMFGELGLYAGDAFFAIVADDTVYLKVDDQTRSTFVEREMPACRPYAEAGPSMGYFQLPPELLEDPDALRPWVDAAIGAARRSRAAKKPRRGRAS